MSEAQDLAAVLAEFKERLKPFGEDVLTRIIERNLDAISSTPSAEMQILSLDTDHRIFFYEQNFYPFSNFSSFQLEWKGLVFSTSEAAYHWEKFPDERDVRNKILNARSAHDAYKIARANDSRRREDWADVKVEIMRQILRLKAVQHEYVRQKLMDSGDRELIENSWRDDFWGWGDDQQGQNMLGKLWMEIREEFRR